MQRPSGPQSTAGTIDPFRVLRKHMLTVIGSAVFGIVFGTVAFVLLFFLMPRYSNAVSFEVLGALDDPNALITSTDFKTETVARIARTELAILMSEEILRKVVNEPQIRNNTEWGKEFLVEQEGQVTYDANAAIDELLEDLRPRYVADTSLFEVSWSAENALDVAPLLNTLADTYITSRRESDRAQSEDDNRVFTDQKTEFQQRLGTLQDEIDAFIRDHRIYTLEDIRYHPVAAEMQGLNQKIAETKQLLSQLSTRYELTQAKLGGQIEPTPEDILTADQDGLVRILLGRIVDYKTRLRSVRMDLSEDHPSVLSLSRDLAAAQEELEATREDVIERNLTGYLKSIANELETYGRMLKQMEVEVQEKEKSYNELAAQVSAYEVKVEEREQLNENIRETDELIYEAQRVRLRTAAERIRRATRAQTPREKSFPNPYIIIPLGFLLVVGCTIGVIFLREFTDTRVKSASDIEIVPGARVIGVIPETEEDPTRIKQAELAVRDAPRSVIAESYRQATTPILKGMQRAGHQSLLIASGLPGAGSTTVLTNVAASMVASGKRVLAIDANFRRPRLGGALRQSDDLPGLGDILSGEAAVEDVIRDCDGIDLMTSGTSESRVFERLNNGAFDTLLARARTMYDYVLIDSAPAVVAGDAMVLANRVDASVLVVRANQEQRGLVARMISQFNDAHGELLGVILNRPRRTAGGYFKKNFATMAAYASDSDSRSDSDSDSA